MYESQLTKIIRSRRSIRIYRNEEISDDNLKNILESGLYAPSGKNRQPWRFVIIKKVEIIKSIAKSTVFSRFLQKVPVMVLVLLSKERNYPIEKDLIGVGACIQNILLTATEFGYGTCVIGEIFNKQELLIDWLEEIDINNYILVCGIAIGQMAILPNKKEIKELKEFVLCVKK